MSRCGEFQQHGVTIHQPESVYLDAALRLENIAAGVTIYPGCRILGAETSIGPDSTVGQEGPVTLDNCQLGRGVALGGGFFTGATLLDGVRIGAGAHVRPGTLLEEQAACGHTVGLKQTILFPFAVTGSLINFCDCLLSGGTSRSDHSEVGSSYVHFNYTPHQDKATPSLLGNVPQGVMLDQPPIFLGGQGGLVGPSRVAFGTIVAAGTVLRRDILHSGRLVFGASGPERIDAPYSPKQYGDIRRILTNNFTYIGNLYALREWYAHVRRLFSAGHTAQACWTGAMRTLGAAVTERIKRLTQFAAHMNAALAGASTPCIEAAARQRDFVHTWPERRSALETAGFTHTAARERDAFLAAVDRTRGSDPYLQTVRALPTEVKATGQAWLQSIVDQTVIQCTA